MKLIEIVQSWYRLINPTPEEKEIAEYRSKICEVCPQNEYLKLGFHVCDMCGCPLQGKIFSPDKSSCPLSKWEK